MSEQIFETEKYRFKFTESRICVDIVVERADGNDITEEDVKEIDDFLQDMGKWETIMTSGLDLLKELGIIHTLPEQHQYFDIKRYTFEPQRRTSETIHWIKVCLTSEERRRREQKAETRLPIEEVANQVKNIPKWRNLKASISIMSELKKH